MLAEKITISKYKILTKYSKLDEKVKTIIEKLYGIEEFNKEYQLSSNLNIKAFKIDKIFLDNIKSNNELKKYENKTGVYIFLKDNIPVYIGFSGKEDKGQSLYGRIVNKQLSTKVSLVDSCLFTILPYKGQSLYGRIVNKQLSTNDTLVTNIKDIETLLNPNLPLLEDRKKLILDYTSSLIVIDCGKKELDNVKFAQALEVILIALFNSKYNK